MPIGTDAGTTFSVNWRSGRSSTCRMAFKGGEGGSRDLWVVGSEPFVWSIAKVVIRLRDAITDIDACVLFGCSRNWIESVS